jgi:hypothetical protein
MHIDVKRSLINTPTTTVVDGWSVAVYINKETIMRRLTFGLVCSCVIMACSGLAGATNYYVAPAASGGSDSNPGTIGSPWATPLKAWTDANAGDTVYFRAGSYAVNTQIWTKYFGHNGTADNPIVFKNYPSENATFTSTLTGQVFIIEKSYNYVEGINFVGASTWFFVAYDTAANHFKASHCTATLTYGGDNTGFVYIGGGAVGTIVEHCRIIGPGYGSGIHGNTAGLIAFRAIGVKLVHNEISNTQIGIYFKFANPQDNPTPDIEIAYNYIHDTGRNSIQTNNNYASIHDNVFGNNNAGFLVADANGGVGGDYNTIEHNTFYNSALTLSYQTGGATDTVPGTIGNTLRNNVFRTTTYVHEYSATAHQTISNYNLYPTGVAYRENAINYTLAAWKTRYPTMDANSITGVPIFVGGTSPMALADFALSSTSPGKNAASDGKDIGADISQVGIQNAAPPTAVNDSYSVYANHTLTVSAATGLLLNDTGTGTLTAIKMTDPSHGSVSLGSDGGFVYTPTTGYTGSDSFTYKAHNSAGDSNTATVSITVNTPPAPTAVNDSYSVYINRTLTVAAGAGLLLNDTDSTGLSLTASKVSDPSHGSVTVNSDGGFTYTPTTGYSGSDSFGYKAYNGFVYSSTATVTITVTEPTRILIDCNTAFLCSTTMPNSDGRYWNNFSSGTITSCTTSVGGLSGIQLTRTTSFNASGNANYSTPINGWPVNAVKDFLFMNNTTATGTMEFSLLDTSGSKTYELTVFGSATDSGTTRYTVLASSTTSRVVNTYGNKTVWPTFSNLTPDTNGKITLQVNLVAGERGPLNVMDLAVYDNGVGNYSMMAGQESSATESASIAVAGTATKTVTAKASNVVSMAGQNSALALNINFQPASVVAPQGYIVDSGMPFGKADNGYTYGWTTDMSSFAAQLNSVASLDVRYDTAIMLVAGGTWEMSVLNGMYDVKIVAGAGDSSSTLAAQKFSIEGVPMTLTKAKTAAGWSEETVTVVVTDGRLTIVGNPGSSLCFVQITGR